MIRIAFATSTSMLIQNSHAMQLDIQNQATNLNHKTKKAPAIQRTHDELKKELLELNTKLWSEWDSLEVVSEVADRNFIAKVKDNGNGPITLLSHIKADGFTWEQFRPFYEDPYSMDKVYELRVKSNKLEGQTTETTSSTILVKAKMPPLVSNRSTMLLGYTQKA